MGLQLRYGPQPGPRITGQPAAPDKVRRCLRCRTDFHPAHVGNYICEACHMSEDYAYASLPCAVGASGGGRKPARR